MNENITKNANMIATKPIEKPGEEKNSIGNIGCSTRLSHRMNTSVNNNPSAATPMVSGEVQPWLGASIIA